jgi:hypothetical protein
VSFSEFLMADSKQSLLLRSLHTLAGGLRWVGIGQADLDPDRLTTEATKKARLSDFGREPWSEAFRQLALSYDSDSLLGPIGRVAIRSALIGLLTNRLEVTEELRKEPGLWTTPITRPVFVLGLARSGTTWMYNLLAQDPGARPLQTWEAIRPVPSPRPETYETDPRIQSVDRSLKGLDKLVPAMRAIHPIKARGPEECLPLLWSALMTPFYRGRVETYREWLAERPQEEFDRSYEFYRLQLQVLQRHVRRDHWILKSPAHLYCVDSLIRAFPDAIVVQMHRDPAAVLPSWCSMTATMDQIFYPKVDPHEVGERTMRILKGCLNRNRHARRLLPPGRIIDVGYHNLIADPRGTVEQIYRLSGLSYTDEIDRSVRDLIRRDQNSDRPKHQYSTEEFGMSRAQIHGALSDYLHDFGDLCGLDATTKSRSLWPAVTGAAL